MSDKTWDLAAIGPYLQTQAREAVRPITDYPSTYGQMEREARNRFLGHMQDAYDALMPPSMRKTAGRSKSDAADFYLALGKAGLDGLEWASAPINAGLRTLVGRPIEGNFGIPKEYSEFTASLAIPGPKRPSAKPSATSSIRHAAEDIENEVFKTASQGPNRELAALTAERRALKQAATDAVTQAQRDAAMTRFQEVEAQIAQYYPRVAARLEQAKANETVAATAARIEEAIARARRSAQKSPAGNRDATIRDEINSLLNDQKVGKSLEDFGVVTEAERVVLGTPTRNALGWVGQLSPTSHPGSAAGHLLLAHATGGQSVGLVPPAFAARKLAEHLAERDARKLVAAIHGRAPHAQDLVKPIDTWSEAVQAALASPNMKNLTRLSAAAGNLSVQLNTVGVTVSPDDLARAGLPAQKAVEQFLPGETIQAP